MTNHQSEGASSNGSENLAAGIADINVNEPEGTGEVGGDGGGVAAPVPDLDPGEFAEFWGDIFGVAASTGATLTGNPGWNYLAISEPERPKWLEVSTRLHKLASKHRKYLGWMLNPMNETAMTLFVITKFMGGKIGMTMAATKHFKANPPPKAAPPPTGAEQAAGMQ